MSKKYVNSSPPLSTRKMLEEMQKDRDRRAGNKDHHKPKFKNKTTSPYNSGN